MNECTHCHRYGNDCPISTCLACGTPQCHGNGSGRGTCRVCIFGRLPTWSWSFSPATCQRAKCSKPAVLSWIPGRAKHVCLECAAVVKINPKTHGGSTTLAEYIARNVQERSRAYAREVAS